MKSPLIQGEERVSTVPTPPHALPEHATATSPSEDNQLERAFRAIVFDWDGTAVVDRRADATTLAQVIADLTRLGVLVVVVTGTNLGNIERQLVRLIDLNQRGHLFVCTNRGSEVYGFDRAGTPARRWLRVATPEEDRALTAIADAVRDAIVARTGLSIEIVYDRLNRRKIDLIPLPEWSDPPKVIIDKLLRAVEDRLRAAGLAGGLGDVLALVKKTAIEHNLPSARITSDVKHIEVGLTDKGDSIAWVRREILDPQGIAPKDVLIGGDEFGDFAGLPGSDAMMLIPEIRGAAVVSVGREPNGVPPGVVLLGGGPARFQELLADQVRLHRQEAAEIAQSPLSPTIISAGVAPWFETALAASADPSWTFTEDGYRPALEHEIESRFAMSNGFLGVRASLEQATSASRPRTYVAGLFETKAEPFAVPTLVAGPDWQRFCLSVGGQPLGLESGTTLTHRRTLDLRRGALISVWGQRDLAEQTTWTRTLRFASLADRSLGILLAQLDPPDEVEVIAESWLAPPSTDLALARAERVVTVWRTKGTARELAVGTTARLQLEGREVRPAAVEDSRCRWTWTSTDRPATLARIVAVARSGEGKDVAADAEAALERARKRGLRRLLKDHERVWTERWAASDVVVDGDEAAQKALRFAIYHMNSAANPDDERVSIGARGLTGDGYLGHVFWETEIFLLPFYIFTWPEAARAMLMYRYHTLPAARAKAARLGFRGALFAWESADTGEEVTPTFVIGPDGAIVPVRCGTDEQHISADVAYAVWQYWQATGDTGFLLDAGAEILLETSRFWASRVVLEADERYHIRGVIGPDEYHEAVDDNAYTNVMAQWNLERGVEVAALLERRWPERRASITGRLQLDPDEIAEWQRLASRLFTSVDPATGLLEQFAGYFDLEPVDIAAYEPRSAPMDLLLGRERIQRSQVVKQADVVMLLALLEDRFPEAVRRTNFSYYEQRCGHGSSLSPPIHALVAARIGDMARAEHYFRETAAIDLDDTMGNAAQGVHVGSLGGLWQATVFGFGGLSAGPKGLRLAPRLPESWRELRFPFRWRGRVVKFVIQRDPPLVTAALEHGRPLQLTVSSAHLRLRRGESLTSTYDQGIGLAVR